MLSDILIRQVFVYRAQQVGIVPDHRTTTPQIRTLSNYLFVQSVKVLLLLLGLFGIQCVLLHEQSFGFRNLKILNIFLFLFTEIQCKNEYLDTLYSFGGFKCEYPYVWS